ncbi:MAG: hypothetical protein ACYDA6_00085 [Solirubrobacteraceae bacterium]
MAVWSAIHVWAAGEVATAANLNNNDADITFLAGTQSANIAGAQTTASTAYADLGTVGPTVTLTTGAHALVTVTVESYSSAANNENFMGFAVSGATVIAATDVTAWKMTYYTATAPASMSATYLVGLTAGSNTFTAKYRVTGGTGTFLNRWIIVQPLP